MGETSTIEWTDATANPWWGCTKVGPGCDHCYAEALANRFGTSWGQGMPRRQIASFATTLAKLNRQGGKRVFISSMSDLFDNEVPGEWFDDAWMHIHNATNCRLQIVTKRISRVEKAIAESGPPIWPQHAGLMITVVNQAEADRDIPRLLALKAKLGIPWVGLSMEPLLGPVDIRHFFAHDPVYEKQAKRAVCLTVGDDGRLGDQAGWNGLEASQAGLGSVAGEGHQSALSTDPRGTRQRGILSGQGDARRQARDGIGTPAGLAALQGPDPYGDDDQPSQWRKERQPAGQSGTGHECGAATPRDSCSDGGPCLPTERAAEQHGKAFDRAGSDDPRPQGDRGEPEVHSDGFRRDLPDYFQDCDRRPQIDHVIVGGESGPKAGPMHPDWARSLRDQCQDAGVPFFFKQWGEWLPMGQSGFTAWSAENVRNNGIGKPWRGFAHFNDGAGGRETHRVGPCATVTMNNCGQASRVGKARAGRLLDGREWNDMPGVLSNA